MMFEDSLSLLFLRAETSLCIISKQQPAGKGRQDVPPMMDVMMDASLLPFCLKALLKENEKYLDVPPGAQQP